MVFGAFLYRTVGRFFRARSGRNKLAAGADSVLVRLDRRDLESGLAAVRRHGSKVGEQAVVEPIDLFVFS